MVDELTGIRDTRLWISDCGEGMPIVLCNGGPGYGDYLSPIAPMISDLARVIRWEPRGCGKSDIAGPYDLATTLADLDDLRSKLGFDSWIVGGHSHGAFLALAYALQYPRHVNGIIYICGTGIQNDRSWSEAYHRGKDEGRELEFADAYPPNLEVNRVGNASARDFCRGSRILRRIADLDPPLFAVQAGADIRPNWPVEQLVELMPNASLTVIPGASHNVWLTHPTELQDILRRTVMSFTGKISE